MSYFDQFPSMYYTFDNVSATLVTNFLARVALSDELKSNVTLYSPYTIADGDTPEIVADKVYGDPQLHWVILLTNEIIDPRYDWCLSQYNLDAMCEAKYANMYGTHHYETTDGYIVDSNYPGAVSISNYQYEDRLNEAKRTIKILNPNLVAEFVKEFATAMGSK
jgi:hypothetical protein